MNSSGNNIFGNRLKLARKMAGFSLQELADSLESKVSKQALSKYEVGLMNPSNEVLTALSKALKLKPDYFLKAPGVELGNVLFRKKAGLSKKNEEAVVEKVRDYVERYLEIEDIVGVAGTFRNPLSGYATGAKPDIERAAWKLRCLRSLDSAIH